MTREKAIEVLENGAWWDLLIPITTIEGRKSDIELHEALDIAIAALRNGWISVEDRLPDENTRVLVFIPYTDTKIDTDRILNGKWVRWIDKITHWQPLPEPPEED
jgi:hypothetical protein